MHFLMALKWNSIGLKAPNVHQENISHSITLSPLTWTIDTRQDVAK